MVLNDPGKTRYGTEVESTYRAGSVARLVGSLSVVCATGEAFERSILLYVSGAWIARVLDENALPAAMRIARVVGAVQPGVCREARLAHVVGVIGIGRAVGIDGCVVRP
jgi:hypothetical protein